MQSFLPILFLSGLVVLALGHESDESEPIHTVQYDTDTFAIEVPKTNHFVMFYAPWCGHCQRLTPTWERLAEMLNEEDTIRIAKIDCTVEAGLCGEENITGYPTLKFYRVGDNDSVKFKGTRDLASLTTFINEQLRTAEELESFIKTLPEPIAGLIEITEANYENALSRGKYFVKFYAPWCGHCQKLAPTWDQLAKSLEYVSDVSIAKMDCTQNREACNKFEIKGYPTLLWFENGKKIDKYQGQRTLDDLKEYINKMLGATTASETVEENTPEEETGSMVVILDGTDFHDSIKSGIFFVKFFAPWCGHCKRLAPTWEDLGKKFAKDDRINVVKVDCTLEANKQLCVDEEVDGFPSIFLYKNGVKMSEYNGKRNVEELHEFVLKHVEEKHDEL